MAGMQDNFLNIMTARHCSHYNAVGHCLHACIQCVNLCVKPLVLTAVHSMDLREHCKRGRLALTNKGSWSESRMRY